MNAVKQRFEAIFDELEKEFYVESWISEEARLIFILESPHIQELKYGAPVSGSSGATMSKHLFGDEYDKPLGRLVLKNHKEHLRRPSLSVIGLMNICGVPMQRKAYGDHEATKNHGDFFDVLEAVRSNNQNDVYRDQNWNMMQDVILRRFQERLAKYLHHPCTMVPCGKFAQKFFRLANMRSDLWQVIDGVPHPSYNSWDRERYRSVIRQLQMAFFQHRDNFSEGGSI
ncbi:MAG TPA: hypothetical protein VFK37_03365 [Bacillales bacterium]|nr:hypothetical protein [Bacillales bacterium]